MTLWIVLLIIGVILFVIANFISIRPQQRRLLRAIGAIFIIIGAIFFVIWIIHYTSYEDDYVTPHHTTTVVPAN